MRLLRISASALACCAFAFLAACGGGGSSGGGSTPPTVAPSGGGGNPPPPSSSPSPSPGASSSPSPTPTQTPIQTPTPTNSPTPTPTNTPGGVTVNTGLLLSAEENFVNGNQGWYTSGTASWANTAGNTSGSGATGNTFDTMNCADTVEGTSYPPTAYSQHAFVGIYNSSGSQEALPQAIGMVSPIAPTQGTPQHPNNNYEVEQYQCEYNVHTHDYSGLVHIEDVNMPQNTTSSPGYATLQTLLDLWGASLNMTTGLTAGNSALNGAVAIYTGMPSAKNGNNDLVNSYTQFTGSPASLVLNRHEAIWIVIGTTPANIVGPNQGTGLPEVQFVLEN